MYGLRIYKHTGNSGYLVIIDTEVYLIGDGHNIHMGDRKDVELLNSQEEVKIEGLPIQVLGGVMERLGAFIN